MPKNKELLFSEDGRLKLLSGVNEVVRAVGVTLGPKGRNVLIEKSYGVPALTKDGVSVAREVAFEDKVKNMGAQLIREASSKTNDAVGDGTSSSAVLAGAMINDGVKHLAAGSSPIALREGIDSATKHAIEFIKKSARKVEGEDILRVASISANDPEIGSKIFEMMKEIGEEGVISVEEGRGMDISTEVVRGMKIDKGYISHFFATDREKMVATMKDVPIFITDKKIAAAQDIAQIMSLAAQQQKNRLVVICEDLVGDALTTAVVNTVKGIFLVLAIKAPGFGDNKREILLDIAALSGATPLLEATGKKFDAVTIEELGWFESVTSEAFSTVLVGGKGDQAGIDKRIAGAKSALEKSESRFDKDKLNDRLAKLSGGIGIIRVGGATEVEVKEKRDRIEDAVSATKAAIEEGVVVGGGKVLLNCLSGLSSNIEKTANMDTDSDYLVGYKIFLHALEAPATAIADNAGVDGRLFVSKAKEAGVNEGYNAATGEMSDLFNDGVIDPAKVVRSAVENAASIAGAFLTIECVISEVPGQDKFADNPLM